MVVWSQKIHIVDYTNRPRHGVTNGMAGGFRKTHHRRWAFVINRGFCNRREAIEKAHKPRQIWCSGL